VGHCTHAEEPFSRIEAPNELTLMTIGKCWHGIVGVYFSLVVCEISAAFDNCEYYLGIVLNSVYLSFLLTISESYYVLLFIHISDIDKTS